MLTDKLNVLIPMAGDGIRFSNAGYILPKPLIPINGIPMIVRAIESLGFPQASFIFVVRKYEEEEYNRTLHETLTAMCAQATIIAIDYRTEGPACTALLAKELINNDTPLIIANCDQIMEWDDQAFLRQMRDNNCDGAVVTYFSETTKNSYARLDAQEQYVVELAEKKVISTHSLNGIHYWKKGASFVFSTEEIMRRNIRVNNEFYISMTYNILIEHGQQIQIYPIEQHMHHAVGVPEDFLRYESYVHKKNTSLGENLHPSPS